MIVVLVHQIYLTGQHFPGVAKYHTLPPTSHFNKTKSFRFTVDIIALFTKMILSKLSLFK
jgi:hypothetical protein